MMRISRFYTFAHVAVAGHGAPAARLRDGSSGGQADDADARLQFRLPLELEEGNVVVQRLAVVIVVDVGGGHSEGLGSGASVAAREVVVSDSDVDGVA